MPAIESNPRIPFQLASDRKKLAPPKPGKPLIVKFDLNLEYWPFDQPMPRRIISAPHGQDPFPDVANFSWAEYGMRCGMPRLFRLFGERKIPIDALLNAIVIDVYPRIAEECLKLGWEFVGHGYLQRSLQREDDPKAVIAKALDRIKAFTGKTVRGWLGPGLHQTMDTPEHLLELGCDYAMDWPIDDLPVWMTTKRGPLLAMPYSLDLNDVVVYAVEKHPGPELYRRVMDTVAVFDRELADQPRVLCVPLHPYKVAVPHRFLHLERLVDALMARNDVVFMTGGQIADWFKAAEKKS
ncbi:MAG: hypothetical protein EXQ96_03920 [Alphaproteobacteria bacterium]|nr:hypothetical protein [Alphaproteobacteria bacterium]